MLSNLQLCQIAESILARLTHQDEVRYWRSGTVGTRFVEALAGERVERVAGPLHGPPCLWLAVKVEFQMVSFAICVVDQTGFGNMLAELDLWQEGELAFDLGEECPRSRDEASELATVIAALGRLTNMVLQELDQLDAAPEQTPAIEVEIEALEFSGRAYQALKAGGITTIGELLALGVPRFRERFPDDYVRADIIRGLATAGYSFEVELTPENILH